MIAFLMMVLSAILMPVSVVFGALALSAAFWSASHWKVTVGETLEMVVFYGALIGCLVGWFGV